MKNTEDGKAREHFKGEEHHPQYLRMREHKVLCLEPRRQNDLGQIP